MPSRPSALIKSPVPLLADIRELILTARERVAQTVNAGLVLLYWQIGQRIRKDILKEKRAGYGEEILQTLSAKLATEFGRGFSERNLANMMRCAEVFPDPKILHALSAELSWTHFRRLIYVDDPAMTSDSPKTQGLSFAPVLAVCLRQTRQASALRSTLNPGGFFVCFGFRISGLGFGFRPSDFGFRIWLWLRQFGISELGFQILLNAPCDLYPGPR
jgi:DUF1016 N-terminal domain